MKEIIDVMLLDENTLPAFLIPAYHVLDVREVFRKILPEKRFSDECLIRTNIR